MKKKNVNENKVIVDIQVNKSNVKYMFCMKEKGLLI